MSDSTKTPTETETVCSLAELHRLGVETNKVTQNGLYVMLYSFYWLGPAGQKSPMGTYIGFSEARAFLSGWTAGRIFGIEKPAPLEINNRPTLDITKEGAQTRAEKNAS